MARALLMNLNLTEGTVTEEHWDPSLYLGVSFMGQQKKMLGMDTVLPHDISSGRCGSKHRGLNRREQDECFLHYW